MAAKFHSRKTVSEGCASIEVGRKSNKPAFKISLNGSTFIVDEHALNDLADAADSALDIFESEPLLWESGSQ